jgi:hypothetical protein
VLAKIHLKTACGCTRVFFQPVDTVPRQVHIPLRATDVTYPFGGPLKSVYDKRAFSVVEGLWKSTRRIELWCEEIVNV